MSDISDALEIRQKYKHFRILVIGRANAGKTTLLKRVCNTTEEPSIYDEGKDEGKINLLEGTDKRGVHDIRRAFTFASNPGFLFHDSAGFEAGGEKELKDVQAFIAERAKANEVEDQLHAIWFCFEPNTSRPLLELEHRFFNEERPQNVPLVAIFTKFDDLITQVYDFDKSEDENRQIAEHELEIKFKKPLYGYKFPPRAHVCTEELNDDDGGHQDQVKELMMKTADSLDDLALKLLFVSVQQNNLELSIQAAMKHIHNSSGLSKDHQVRNAITWFSHAYKKDHKYEHKERLFEKDDDEEFSGGRFLFFLLSYYETLVHNSKAIATFQETNFHDGTFSARIAAVIICTENTFWYQSKGVTFIKAFELAFTSYVETGTKKKVEALIQALGDYPSGQSWPRKRDQEKYKASMTEILLKHLLAHPN